MYRSIGSHGTSKSRVDSISRNGFRESAFGRRGKGVYFWYADECGCDDARNLARSWYKYAEKRGEYKSDENKQGQVIWAKIGCAQENLLKLTEPKYRTTIRKLVESHIKDAQKKGETISNDEAMSLAHDMFISRLSSKHPIDVVLATVAAPKKMNDELLPFLGEPFAHIVKNMSCITMLPALTEDIK